LDLIIEENNKVYARRIESLKTTLSLKMDSSDFIRMDAEFKTLQKLKRKVDLKADNE